MKVTKCKAGWTEIRSYKIKKRNVFFKTKSWLISGFRRGVDWSCALMGYYAALSGSSVRTFRYNVSVTSSKVKKPSWISWHLKMRPIRCHETSVKDYHSTLCNNPEERRSNAWLLPMSPKLRHPKLVWLATPAISVEQWVKRKWSGKKQPRFSWDPVSDLLEGTETSMGKKNSIM